MNINKLIERGEDALKKRNYDYAIEVFMEAVRFAPNSRKAREGLRRAQLKKREPAYPNPVLVALFGLPARLGMFFTGLGKKANPEPFMMACEKFLCLDPKNRAVNTALGDAAAAAGHLDAAIVAYETAAESNPDDVSALKKLAHLHHKTGDLDRAHETYNRVVELNPKDQEAIKARKNVAAEASLIETGFETAKSSQELVRDKEALGRLEQESRLYRDASDLDNQRLHLEERVAKEPENADLLLDLAEVLKKQRNWDEALATVDKAIAVKPGDQAIAFIRGDYEMERIEADILELKRAGKEEEAAARQKEFVATRTVELEKRVKAYPTDLKLRFQLGEMLFEQGKLDDAISQFQQTVRDPKYKSESQLRLGRAFASKGQHDLAVRQLSQALEGQAGMTERVKDVYYTLGDVYTQMGDGAKAKEAFGKIYEVDIKFRDVADRISKLDAGSDAGKLSLSD